MKNYYSSVSILAQMSINTCHYDDFTNLRVTGPTPYVSKKMTKKQQKARAAAKRAKKNKRNR